MIKQSTTWHQCKHYEQLCRAMSPNKAIHLWLWPNLNSPPLPFGYPLALPLPLGIKHSEKLKGHNLNIIEWDTPLSVPSLWRHQKSVSKLHVNMEVQCLLTAAMATDAPLTAVAWFLVLFFHLSLLTQRQVQRPQFLYIYMLYMLTFYKTKHHTSYLISL